METWQLQGAFFVRRILCMVRRMPDPAHMVPGSDVSRIKFRAAEGTVSLASEKPPAVSRHFQERKEP